MFCKRLSLIVVSATLVLAGSARAACPGRLVTLGGDITATVFALGAGQCVVADDTTSEYPPAAKKLPRVGYLRTLNAEGVLSLRPDMILASADAGPPAVVTQLKEAGVKVILVPEKHTVDDTIAKIETVAAALDRKPAAQKIGTRMRATFDALDRELAGIAHRQRVVFLLTMGGGSPMAGGRNTAADGIIRLAGGINAATFSGYKPLSAEALIRLKPDVILIMSETFSALGGVGYVSGLPGVKLTPAARDHRVFAIDGTFMLGFGPRLGQAASQLAGLLYPSLFNDSPSAQNQRTPIAPTQAQSYPPPWTRSVEGGVGGGFQATVGMSEESPLGSPFPRTARGSRTTAPAAFRVGSSR